jgi:hypothetical protein
MDLDLKKTLALNDSLPEDLERLVSLSQVDWTGKLIGRTEMAFWPVPVVENNSAVYAKITEWINILEKSLIAAEPQQILIALARLRLHCPTVTMSEYESELLIKDYIADLSEFPLDLIIQACNEYRYGCDNKFFPSIAKLLDLIKRHIYFRRLKLTKLKKLKEASDTQEKNKVE